MKNLEQENRELREEVIALKVGMVNLNALVESLVVAQNQPPPPPLSPHATQPKKTTVILEVLLVPISITPVTVTQYRMPCCYPWGMPGIIMLEGYNPAAQVSPFIQDVVVSAPPLVHIVPVINNEINHVAPHIVNVMLVINDEVYHPTSPPSESLGFYDRMDDFQDQFNEMQK